MNDAVHHHPTHDAVEITPLRNWIWPFLRRAGYCLHEQGGASCVLSAGHNDSHEHRDDNFICVDVVRGRILT